MDDVVEDLEGTVEEGRDIFIQLSNVKFKDLDAIERELSNYGLENPFKFE
jgi:hypothetical protein